MSSLHSKKFRTNIRRLKSVQYILRQARSFPVCNINAILKSSATGVPETTDPFFYKTLQLTFFADDPLQAAGVCSNVIEKCLAQDNSEAHYIEGMLLYFCYGRPNDGLNHLRRSADGMYASGTVIYEVLMLCLGHTEEGKRYLDTLEWKASLKRIGRSWCSIKKSLRRSNAVFTRRYRLNMQRLEPPESCHVNDLETFCERCFYYKQIKQFLSILC